MELQRLGEAPAQQGAAPAAPGPQQAGEDQRRAALQLSGDEAWRRRGAAAAPPSDGWGGGGLGSGGGLGLGGGAAAPPPPGAGQPKGMSLAQASADAGWGWWRLSSDCSALMMRMPAASRPAASLPLLAHPLLPRLMPTLQKLLEKMGWKEGEGLGRNRQGMATPLMMQVWGCCQGEGQGRGWVSRLVDVVGMKKQSARAWAHRSRCRYALVVNVVAQGWGWPATRANTLEALAESSARAGWSCRGARHPDVPRLIPASHPVQKTDVRTGVIVNAAPSSSGAAEQPAKRQRTATFNRPPTRVVLLTNMVRGGAVDCGGWLS